MCSLNTSDGRSCIVWPNAMMRRSSSEPAWSTMWSAYGVPAQPSSMLAMRTFGKRPNRLPSTSATQTSRIPRSELNAADRDAS